LGRPGGLGFELRTRRRRDCWSEVVVAAAGLWAQRWWWPRRAGAVVVVAVTSRAGRERRAARKIEDLGRYRWPNGTRPMGQPEARFFPHMSTSPARFFGPTRARAQHDFFGLGPARAHRRAVLGCDLSPPCRPSTARNRATRRGPLGWHEAHQPKWPSGPTTYKSGAPSPKPYNPFLPSRLPSPPQPTAATSGHLLRAAADPLLCGRLFLHRHSPLRRHPSLPRKPSLLPCRKATRLGRGGTRDRICGPSSMREEEAPTVVGYDQRPHRHPCCRRHRLHG
jgi:hypothetical protein